MDGNNAAPVFSMNGVAATLIALTTQHGSASLACGPSVLRGGGIDHSGARTPTNSTVTSNSATRKVYGGVWNTGTFTVMASTFTGNSASGGGGTS